MIKLLINQQALSVVTPVVVAGTDEYLTLSASFTPDWEGLSKYVHFIMGDQHLTFAMTDNMIREEARMNLTRGTWEVYVVGTLYENEELTQRITTETQLLEMQIEGVYGREPDTPHDPYSPRTDGDDYLLHDDLAEVAFSGDYNDLINLPDAPIIYRKIGITTQPLEAGAVATQQITLPVIAGYQPVAQGGFNLYHTSLSPSTCVVSDGKLNLYYRNGSTEAITQSYTGGVVILYLKDE